MLVMLSCKEEPVSPLNAEEASLLDDETFYQSSFDDFKIENDHFTDCESKAEVASHILENLEKLVDLDELIKSEPSFLLDDKILPLLDDVEPPYNGAVAVPVKPDYFKLSDESNTYLYNEIEKVYFQLNHGTLTPPQSPPISDQIAQSQQQQQQPVIATLQPLLGPNNGEAIYHVPEKAVQPPQSVLAFPPISSPGYGNVPILNAPQPDIALELAVVDEIVRSTVEDMHWSNSPPSPESSSNGSNFGDGGSSSSSDDPEWMPEPIENYHHDSLGPIAKAPRKRSKPYSHASDDKKSRKKEQNKNAATRYRMKKKAEVEVILSEEKSLLDKNGELTGQVTDLQREIKYLKGLMRDLLKAKGVIN